MMKRRNSHILYHKLEKIDTRFLLKDKNIWAPKKMMMRALEVLRLKRIQIPIFVFE
jgi:hypothetical protein